ncbi:DUF1499 domain-containing protein [Roseovarius sp. 2305UL8-3]|uniref:DUF1499 domain-containing protein n=1 Tax=Roseovarius conchicola TaxID=3121636 RepID=UPI003528D19C
MNWLVYFLVAVVLGAIGVAVWARMAPSDPAIWHAMPGAVTDRDMAGGAMRVVGAGEDGLTRLDQIIRAEPRTQVLAGSADDGMITYIARSRLFGFPDYITTRQNGPQIEIYARLRFGASDLGVNARRLDRWLALLGQGG